MRHVYSDNATNYVGRIKKNSKILVTTPFNHVNCTAGFLLETWNVHKPNPAVCVLEIRSKKKSIEWKNYKNIHTV